MSGKQEIVPPATAAQPAEEALAALVLPPAPLRGPQEIVLLDEVCFEFEMCYVCYITVLLSNVPLNCGDIHLIGQSATM